MNSQSSACLNPPVQKVADLWTWPPSSSSFPAYPCAHVIVRRSPRLVVAVIIFWNAEMNDGSCLLEANWGRKKQFDLWLPECRKQCSPCSALGTREGTTALCPRPRVPLSPCCVHPLVPRPSLSSYWDWDEPLDQFGLGLFALFHYYFFLIFPLLSVNSPASARWFIAI